MAKRKTPPQQSFSDESVIAEWAHGKSPHTARAYHRAVERFQVFVARPLNQVSTRDIQRWYDQLPGAPKSKAQALAAIKSLYAYAAAQGYVARNPAAAVRSPRTKTTTAERLLTADEAERLIAAVDTRRDRVLLTVLLHAGLRAGEAVALCWRDCVDRPGERGQITVQGKGQKTRHILLPASTWEQLQGLRGQAGQADPVFVSRKGGALSYRQLHHIVRQAAQQAGIDKPVSPHWLRHAHATIALDRGTALKTVSETLGHADIAITGQYLHLMPDDSSALAFEEPPDKRKETGQ